MYKRFKSLTKDFVAAGFWLYLLTKVFVYDFDTLLFSEYAPGWEFLISYRYFFLIGSVALTWIIIGHKRFWLLIAQVLFFPLTVLLWRIPKSLFTKGNWFFILTYINSIANFIKSLRRSIVLIALFSIGTLCLLAINTTWGVGLGGLLLAATLISHYISRTRVAFRPLSFLAVDSKTLLKTIDYETLQKRLAGTSANLTTTDSKSVG